MTWIALPQPSLIALAEGSWSPTTVGIVADPGFEREAERFGAELAQLGIAAGDGARIVLRRQRALGAEEFRIDVTADITVLAATATGVFRATRQLLHNLRAQQQVPHGHVESAPAVAERGVHVDAARKFFPANWLKELLRELADVGINVFQWHLSENEGVRLEFRDHPEIVSAEFITRAEAEEILALAADLHIQVVPSLDMPGHLRHALAEHPELQLPGVDQALDITKPEAVRFARELIDDIAPVFWRSTRWNLGADEFVDFGRIEDYPTLAGAARERFGAAGSGFDLLTDFARQIAEHLRGLGFEARVWNDGMLRGEIVDLDRRMELAWWTNWHPQMAPLSRATEYPLVNVNDSLFYYVLGNQAGYRHPTSERIWAEAWHPGRFPDLRGIRQEIAAPYPARLLGCSFAVWCDEPDRETPAQVLSGIRRPVRAMSERAWNAGSRLDHSEFAVIDAALNPTGQNPTALNPTAQNPTAQNPTTQHPDNGDHHA